jgi:hypothetical protein
MRKHLLPLLLLSLTFWSCEDDHTDYAALIQGTWVIAQIDHLPVPTDSLYVCIYRPDMVELYAKGFALDGNNSTWMENDQYNYSVHGNIVTLTGTDVFDNEFLIVLRTEAASATTMTQSVIRFEVNGVDYPDPKVYTYRKVTSDYRDTFTGTWFGFCTTPGTPDTNDYYWTFHEDGTWDFFYPGPDDSWMMDLSGQQHYFLYGDLFVCNYTDVDTSDGNDQTYDCWTFQISGDTMIWTSVDAHGVVNTFRMEKVDHGPSVGFPAPSGTP